MHERTAANHSAGTRCAIVGAQSRTGRRPCHQRLGGRHLLGFGRRCSPPRPSCLGECAPRICWRLASNKICSCHAEPSGRCAKRSTTKLKHPCLARKFGDTETLLRQLTAIHCSRRGGIFPVSPSQSLKGNTRTAG